MSERPEVDWTGVPDWLRKGLESAQPEAAEPGQPRAVTDLRSSPSWPLMLDAALSASFLPRDLGPGNLSGGERQRAERAVLDFATQVREADGLRWSLSREARARTIEGSTPEELAAAAVRTSERFVDPVSGALRRLATERGPQEVERAKLPDLEPLRTAVSLLGESRTLALPNLEDLDRRVQLLRLRAGFERMTGAGASVPSEAGGTDRTDRFYGREDELEALRSYVDVVAAQGASNVLGRLVSRVRRYFVPAPPMSLWGTGGVGKTTLMAKFMLEHACAGNNEYPFAYLDFERSTVSARDPAGLLAEMCRQVASQFRTLAGPLGALAAKLSLAGRRIAAESAPAASLLLPYQREFRQHIDDYLDSIENQFSRLRPFLLVFDTFEIVQYSPEDVRALEHFVGQFATSAEGRLWQRLRLVISGRRAVPEFLGKVTELALGPLTVAGAREMLQAMAAEQKLTLSRQAATKLVEALAGGRQGIGVHPLRLRLVGEVFRHTLDVARLEDRRLTGDRLAQSLIEDLQRTDSRVSTELVNGFLVRRILDHLIDPRVCALADPGMIVRIITPDVIREVLAQATPEPGSDEADSSDRTDYHPWALSPEAAEEIYQAFEHEVTLVEVDGGALRFRQDVRKEMIPLIRIRRPNRFRHLHQVAWRYFSKRADLDPTDLVAAAEAVYHGLWLELPLETVGRYWRPNPQFLPRIDPEEFDPMGNAGLFLRAKSGERLTAIELDTLGPDLAWEWLQGRSNALLWETSFNEEAAAVRAAAGPRLQALTNSPAVAANAARLFFRAGEWDDAVNVAEGVRDAGWTSPDEPGVQSLFRTWLTVVAKSGAEGDPAWVSRQIVGIEDPIVQVETLAHLRLARFGATPPHGRLEEVASLVSTSHWASEPRILRLAILLSEDPRVLLAVYLQTVERLPRDRSTADIVRRLFADCYRSSDNVEIAAAYGRLMEIEDYSAQVEAIDTLFRLDRNPLVTALERPDFVARCGAMIAGDHRDWIRQLTCAVERLLQVRPAAVEAIKEAIERPSLSIFQQRRRAPLSASEIVLGASEEGNLIGLARALTKVGGNDKGTRYPRSATALAAALLRWDERIKELRRSGPGPSALAMPAL